MKILAVESSAKACSVAVCQDDKLLAQHFINSGLTHSKTLLPMISAVLEASDNTLQNMDYLAVAAGPGSFTGLRIGVATVKGLAWASEIPCIACSTLGSMAWQLAHLEGYTVVSAMDARRKQVYSNHYMIQGGKPIPLSEDGAVSIEDLSKKLEIIDTAKILVGDGAELCSEVMENISIAPPHLRLQSAWGVAQEARENRNKAVSWEDLMPEYHRLSQAERERLEKMNRDDGESIT